VPGGGMLRHAAARQLYRKTPMTPLTKKLRSAAVGEQAHPRRTPSQAYARQAIDVASETN